MITVTISDARQVAAATRKTAAYNAGLPPDATHLTVAQYLASYWPLAEWADLYAPAVIPSGEWLQRWTDAEKAAIRAMTDPQVKAWLAKLDAYALVTLTDADVVNGVPYVCALLEQQGTLAAGQGAVRAAQVLAF